MRARRAGLVERGVRLGQRLRGVAAYPDPWRAFGPGGLEEAEALCAEAGRDLRTWIRPPADLVPGPVERHPAGGRGLRLRITVLRFPSPRPSRDPDNDTVTLRILRPTRRPGHDRVVLFHHPLFQRRWDLWDWFLADLATRTPVALLANPWHMERTPEGHFPGEGMVNANPARLYEGIRQWAWDRRAAEAALAGEGFRPAATVGFSLGAFQVLLAASAGEIEHPLVSIASTNNYAHGLRHGILGSGILDAMVRVGIDRARLVRMAAGLVLDRHVAPLRGRPVLYIAGAWDRVDPPPSGDRLREALVPSHVVLLPAGHASVLAWRPRVTRAVVRFLEETGVL